MDSRGLFKEGLVVIVLILVTLVLTGIALPSVKKVTKTFENEANDSFEGDVKNKAQGIYDNLHTVMTFIAPIVIILIIIWFLARVFMEEHEFQTEVFYEAIGGENVFDARVATQV